MAEIDIRVDESNVRIDQFLVNKYPTLSGPILFPFSLTLFALTQNYKKKLII